MSEQQITLGELAAMLRRKQADKPVVYDFGRFIPDGIHSYRGDYSEIAIGYGIYERTVADVLKEVEDAIGKTFTGYKGGEYVMDDDTPVWVAQGDEAGSVAIVDVMDDGKLVSLRTERLDG